MVVECNNLIHRYGRRLALNGVSFSVEKGNLFGLVGPNGGGKSTTFKILATILRPNAGSVRLFGLSTASHSQEIRSRLGVVFQSPALDKKLTVLENLKHQGHLYGLMGRRLRLKCETAMKRFGISDRARDRVETLSGGLKRRLEIAKAMLHEPEMLILDEPTTGLDPLARKELWESVSLLRKEFGVTTLFTTHLLEEAESCDELLFLDQGKKIAFGKPSSLRAEVGGEVIAMRSQTPEALRDALIERFHFNPRIVGLEVRVAKENGAGLVQEILDQMGGWIESLSIGKPTLEDFYISHTGKRFEEARL